MLNAVNATVNTPQTPLRSAPDNAPEGAAPDGFARAIAKAKLAERDQNRQLHRTAEPASKGPQKRPSDAADDGSSGPGITKPGDTTAPVERDPLAQEWPVAADMAAAGPVPGFMGRVAPTIGAGLEISAWPQADTGDDTGTFARTQAALADGPAHAHGTGAAGSHRGLATALFHNVAAQRVQSALQANPVAATAAATKSRDLGDMGHTLPLAADGATPVQAEQDKPGKVMPASMAALAPVIATDATAFVPTEVETDGKALPEAMAALVPGIATGEGEGQSATRRDSAGGRAAGQRLGLERQEGANALEGVATRTDPKAEDTQVKPTSFAQSLSSAQSEAAASPFNVVGSAGTVNTSAAAPNTPAQATLSARPGSEAFVAQASQQIAVFVRDGVHTARLNLNPAEMGPVTVQIQLDGLNAQVHLAAEQGLTRQALEQSMPMLASQLRESGLTLTGGGVFEQPRQTAQDGGQGQNGNNPRDSAQAGDARTTAAAGDTGPGSPAASGRPLQRTRGMVDLVA